MSFYFFVSANLINRYKNKFFFFLLADEGSCYQKIFWNGRQHQDKILNSTPAPKKSPPCLLTCSGPLPSLSICTAPGPLLSLSHSSLVTAPVTTPCHGSAPAMCRLGGHSDDHPAPRLRRPPHAVHYGGSAIPTTPCPSDRFDDKEALQWVVLKRIPTHPVHHRGLPPSLLFLEHIALGYFPISELTAVPTTSTWAW
jgi:hypothetical protein